MCCCKICVVAVVLAISITQSGAIEYKGRLTDHEFGRDIDFAHPDTGEVLKLKTHGKLRSLINLRNVPGLKRIVCISNKLIFIFEDAHVANEWANGDVITGDDQWECQQGLSHAAEKGIFRKISSVKKVNSKRIEVITSEASFYDIFEHAKIFYHRVPAKKEPKTYSSYSKVRQRRGWISDGLETINDIKENVVGAIKDPLSLIFPVEWNFSNGKSVGVNYDPDTNSAVGTFVVSMGKTQDIGFETVTKTLLQHQKTVETKTSRLESTGSVKSRLECTTCYFAFDASVIFELEMSRDSKGCPDIKKYILQLNGQASIFYDLSFTISGEYNMKYNKKLWQLPTPVTFEIMLVLGLKIDVQLTPELWLDASIQSNGEVSFTTGFDATGSITVTNRMEADGQMKVKVDPIFNANRHRSKIDYGADVLGSISVHPKVEVAVGIGWGKAGVLDIVLSQPFAIGLKPVLKLSYQLHSAMGKATLGTFKADLFIGVPYEIRKARLSISLLKMEKNYELYKWAFGDTIGVNTFNLASDEKLVCPVAPQITCRKRETHQRRHKRSSTSSLSPYVIWDGNEQTSVDPSLLDRIRNFVDVVRREDGWSRRKLLVRPSSKGNYQVELGVTGSDSNTADNSPETLAKLKKLANCAEFCDVEKRQDKIVVSSQPKKQNTVANMYMTRFKRPQPDVVRVYELPVGQGDAVVIQCPSGDLTFVDLGSISAETKGYFSQRHLNSFINNKQMSKVKHIFVTHAHSDHFNFIGRSIPQTKRGNIKLYYPRPQERSLKDNLKNFTYVPIGKCQGSCRSYQICTAPSIAVMRVLLASQTTRNKNNNGIVLRLEYGNLRMLFVGDIEGATTVAKIERRHARADVYKLAHHGSKGSAANSNDFLHIVQPSVIISSGDPWNAGYGHPRCEILEEALKLNSVRKSGGDVTFKPQSGYHCGRGVTNDKKKQLDFLESTGSAVFTHAPAVNKINMIVLNLHSSSKISIVTDEIETTSHSTSRRKRSTESSGPSLGNTNSGGDWPSIEWCGNDFAALNRGQSSRDPKSEEEFCKPIVYPVKRSDERFSQLFYYIFDDVLFINDEKTDSWCGLHGEHCNSCEDASEEDDVMDRCADRMMSFRLAYRLRRLASLASQKWSDGRRVQVQDAWSEKTSSSRHSWGKFPDGSLHYEGRAAKLKLENATAEDLRQLSILAQCAGFDYVKMGAKNVLEVCALPQEEQLGEMVSFPKAQLLAIDVPTYMAHEYSYPEEHKNETRTTKLLDGRDVNKKLSEHFSVKDFVYPGKHFFRLDDKLLECLELLRGRFQDFKIADKSAYRTYSVNNQDITRRHVQEKFRFQSGQAVELQHTKSSKHLMDLARETTRSCLAIFNFEQMVLGLGAHKERVYLDMRPQVVGESRRLTVWDAEGAPWYKELNSFATQINEGGALIDPVNSTRACLDLPFGEDFYFITEQSDKDGSCSHEEAGFCGDTKKVREKAVKKFKKDVGKIVKGSSLTKDIDNCFVTNCGCGIGYGSSWDGKLRSCLKFLSKFIDKASVPFPDASKASFYNTANVNSSVHSLSCDDGLCAEKTQIHSLLKHLLMTTYKPSYSDTIEEMVFSSRDNPNPSLTLLEQFMAMAVEGQVNVYIEKDQDLSALRKILKILMVFNRKVVKVTFHVASTANSGKIQENAARKSEFWATGACPDRSRVAITPFEVKEIDHHRMRRSIELSETRNKRMAHIHDWEMRWLSKN